MAAKFSQVYNRNPKRRAYAVHHHVVMHPIWVQLSMPAKVLWLELGLEYYPESKDGKQPSNNGWIASPYSYLIEKRGFRSRSTIKDKLLELEWFGFIEKTSPGQFPKEPARYALTHLDYGGHPEIRVRAKKAPHTYKDHSGEPFKKRVRKNKPTVHLATSLGTDGGTKGKDKKKHSPANWTREDQDYDEQIHY